MAAQAQPPSNPSEERPPSPEEVMYRGFALPYGTNRGGFRFYFMAFVAVMAFGLYVSGGHQLMLPIGIAAGSIAYYFYPLIEGRPRIGANEYGVFCDGLGLIPWREVNDILLREFAVRNMSNKELHIQLKRDLDHALIADWRRQKLYRILMKLPWKLGPDNLVRVRLEPFGPAPEQIHATMLRLWRYYGS
jgi:hypothetical protein